MKIGLNIGGLNVNVSSTGGVRVGKRMGGTYISQQIIKPNRSSKKKGIEPASGGELGF